MESDVAVLFSCQNKQLAKAVEGEGYLPSGELEENGCTCYSSLFIIFIIFIIVINWRNERKTALPFGSSERCLSPACIYGR